MRLKKIPCKHIQKEMEKEDSFWAYLSCRVWRPLPADPGWRSSWGLSRRISLEDALAELAKEDELPDEPVVVACDPDGARWAFQEGSWGDCLERAIRMMN